MKRYHEERGTGVVDDIVGGAAPVVVSSLAILEVTAAVHNEL
ncbi:MAG: hypothetical protein Q7R39_11605 [Dehalococcoidia bacterium]|nr:hypothetical protein [Dehalococcoidia bacterium]